MAHDIAGRAMNDDASAIHRIPAAILRRTEHVNIRPVHERSQVVARHALDDEAHLVLEVGAQVALADHTMQHDLVCALLYQLPQPGIQVTVVQLTSVNMNCTGFRARLRNGRHAMARYVSLAETHRRRPYGTAGGRIGVHSHLALGLCAWADALGTRAIVVAATRGATGA